MKETQLTAAQVRELQPYERHFKQATEAAWCSYPGQAGIDKMCEIWQALTGTKYPYQPGCANCLLNLVRDLGHIYFAQKDAVMAAAVPAEGETETSQPDAPSWRRRPAPAQR